MAPAYLLLGGALALVGYTYVGYPAVLCVIRLIHRARRAPAGPAATGDWPRVSILVPVHNAAATLSATLEGLLSLHYPPERRQILVASDASTDRSDDIARGLASRGVELLRLPARRGKTAAENAACPLLTGEIVVTVDASSRLPPHALKALIAAFQDPSVGVASGRDVSVSDDRVAGVAAEAGYVGYEMWVRRLETEVGGIVGASGCFYAERVELYRHPSPEHLSRDFAASLVARLHGYRAVSVSDALCYVPRSTNLKDEYRRKVRTVARGLATLWHFRALLHPLRHGLFAWMLFSHKVCRWLAPWALAGAGAGAAVGWLAAGQPWAPWAVGGLGLLVAATALGFRRPRLAPRWCVPLCYGVAANLAVVHAWLNFWTGRVAPYWEPTRRTSAGRATSPPGDGASPETSGA